MAGIDGAVITEFINKFVTDLSDSIVNKALDYNQSLLLAVSAFISAVFLVYLVWRTIEYITDDNPPPLTLVFKEILVITLLGSLTFGGSIYNKTIATMVMDSGDDLAMAITGQKAITSVVTIFGGFISKVFALIENSGGLSLWNLSIIAVISFVALLVSVYAMLKFFIECLGLLVLVKFMCGILIAVGGLFICAAYFKPVRAMFYAWCSQCLKYVLTNVMLCIALSLIVGVLASAISDITLTNLLIFLCCLSVGKMIIEQIPALVSNLSTVSGD